MGKQETLAKWRLILGKSAEKHNINYNSPPNSSQNQNQSQPGGGKPGGGKPGGGKPGGGKPGGGKPGGGKSGGGKKRGKGKKKGGGGGQGNSKLQDSPPSNSDTSFGNFPKHNQTTPPSQNESRKERLYGDNSDKSLSGAERGQGTDTTSDTSQNAQQSPAPNLSSQDLQNIDNVMDYLYQPPPESQRSAGKSGTGLSIPKWLENVNRLFPKEAKEILERDLVKKANIREIIKHPELFDKVEPNMEMLGIMMHMKNRLPAKIRDKVKQLVAKVVNQLRKKLKQKVIFTIVGSLNRNQHTPLKNSKNFDWKQTIQRNLKHYNKDLEKIILNEPRFFRREKKKNKWRIIILIDESGSMTESIIHSAVIASIFAEIPAVSTNLIIFDTQVVDLSHEIGHPVEVLMSTTLRGGTNIAKALQYGQTLVRKPKKTLFILISDFYEGGSTQVLTQEFIKIKESGAKLIGIAALGRNSRPNFNRSYAREINKIGFDVIVCTPEVLAEMVGKVIQT
ncbi:MAG: VWA domain-containing protein [Promethearchaeota archaeon]